MKEETSDLKTSISPVAAVLVIVLTFVATLVVGTAYYFFLSNFPLGGQVTFIIGEVTILLVPLAYMLYKKIDIKSYIGLGNAKLRNFLLGIGLGLGTWLMGIFASLAFTLIMGPSQAVEEANKIIVEFAKESAASIVLIALSLVLAGICEEFAFRGFLQNALGSRYSFPVALIGSSAAFGLFHFDPQATYIIVAFLYGLVWGYAYNRLKSYIVVASAHLVTDLTSLTILLLLIHTGMI